ncbi:hypothetical protein A1Q2_03929 [Trichosporon asahii var. asahii CBS 8904]|uniref:Uncharacterized protein n=2 Tax=Trichosporon asahii var. asahii TaxID=189963 RepID=K1VMD1_TRIAC|nr:hypothetical protein A1Q1_08256 [Trichosporon asahii var. asahii CBS 2479]EJT50704.1 hypothetical protein A1Q1_08256 [Trichosporon asahii var. asahii CBS 2479]EKD01866.1 hypothetical protein A1Q2_03929 [Trichosporon asahii var. asahii CBS 8904]
MSPRLTVPRSAVRQFLCTNLGTAPHPALLFQAKAALQRSGHRPALLCLSSGPWPLSPRPPSASSASSAHLAAIQTLLAQLTALAFLVAPPYRLPEPFRGLLADPQHSGTFEACRPTVSSRNHHEVHSLFQSLSEHVQKGVNSGPSSPSCPLLGQLDARAQGMCSRSPHAGINSTDGSFPTAKDAQRKDDAKEIRSESAHSTSGAIHPDMPDRLTA